MTAALLRVDGLVTGYSRAPILHGVGFELQRGEIVGLFGANGAGKSTLLRALAGTLPSWSGRIELNGHDITRRSPWRRVKQGVALVPEGRLVFRAMTVADNLRVASMVRPAGAADRLEAVFTLFPRLAERRRQEAGTLSGGEQQMLAIGRALMTEPALLLVDEMSAGLAPVLVQRLTEGLEQIRDGWSVGVLLVEQSPNFVAGIITRAVLLENGRVTGSGTVTELGGAEGLSAAYLGVTR